MKKNWRDFFWPSYVDLLTGLFIVMLVLFILSYKSLSDSKKATEEQLKKITEVQTAVQHLDANYFIYESTYKRYTLNRQVQFKIDSDSIPRSNYQYLSNVGHSINAMIDDLIARFGRDSIKYVIIIEGMASRDRPLDKSLAYVEHNYNLSYQRARAVYRFWNRNGIYFSPKICEVLITGSGLGGVGRFEGTQSEFKNQRILIQIIPKLSKF